MKKEIYQDFTVVLPTLNEEKNIGTLIKKIFKEYPGMSVVVADDGSRDKTREVVKKMAQASRKVHLIDRAKQHKERGLTASAVDGILSSKTKFSIVMDADLQHPTEVIGGIAMKLLLGSDLVVAVRADVTGWQLHRKIISKTLIIIGYIFLSISGRAKCNDIFSGFFGVNTKAFIRTYEANQKRFVMGGYKILYDFLKCTRKGMIKIDEVPYSFGTRKYGASKAGFKQGMLLFKSFLT